MQLEKTIEDRIGLALFSNLPPLTTEGGKPLDPKEFSETPVNYVVRPGITSEGDYTPRSNVGFYYAGEGQARHIIGLGPYSGGRQEVRSIRNTDEQQRAVQELSQKMFSYYVLEGKTKEEIINLIAQIATVVKQYHPPARPLVAVVENGYNGLVQELLRDSRYVAHLDFVRASKIGDTIDVCLSHSR
ncbi:MAG: hypothetical protein AABX13_04435 [Nanoarchaeota archaeon]